MIKTIPSITLTFISRTASTGAINTTNESRSVDEFICLPIFKPFPKIASRGIIKKKITIIPPIKSPTNNSGRWFKILLMPSPISGVEVSIPRTKKETAKDDRRTSLEKRDADDTMRPAANQSRRKAFIYTKKLKIPIFLV